MPHVDATAAAAQVCCVEGVPGRRGALLLDNPGTVGGALAMVASRLDVGAAALARRVFVTQNGRVVPGEHPLGRGWTTLRRHVR